MDSILFPVCVGTLIFACGLVTGWALHMDRHVRPPQPKPTTLFHVEASHGIRYTVESIDEARDLADWLEGRGVLAGFWYEEIDA